MSSRAQSRAPSQMSGLDVAGLLNRLLIVSTTTYSKPELTLLSVSNQLELKPKRKLSTVNSS